MNVIVQGLVVRYHADDPAVLDGADLQVRSGERVAIVGASGCGKSTLLAHLAGLRRPQAGHVQLGDVRLDDLGESALDALRAASIGFVFQRARKLPYLSARENIELALGVTSCEADIDALLLAVGLAPLARRRASALSVGEAQRVAVARALVKSPALVIADEPTGSLDGAAADAVSALLLAPVAQRTVLVATHDEHLAQRCDRIVRLGGGRLR